ncbi:MOP flippase family protein [Congregibacter variabilis]|uniref:MOP flippase family protein n=1 Tax=Congregibacter variabilis TaxID=3081200 RepID=A0ABZ0I1N0_9GAMM|nr:MOP flippase family protein [Congregibacter sp. IMCC43200]
MSLAAGAFSAGRWTALSSVYRAIAQLLNIAVLARFLAPQDFGLMAMVMVVLSYGALFSDMGLSTAFVQRRDVSHEERSSLYWLSVLMGVVVMLLFMAISPFAAMFFGEQQLVTLMMLLATNFLGVALGQQLRMDSEKSLNFKPVALIEITAASTGLVVAVSVAVSGGGVYALVASAMVTTWLSSTLFWFVLAKGWRPTLRLRWDEVRWFVRFGGGMVVNNTINHVNMTLDLVVGGRMLTTDSLGFYAVPRNLILHVQMMINPIFTRVGFPLIASIQHDRDRVRLLYLKTMNLSASVNAPIYVALTVFAPEFVGLLLGSGWEEAVPIVRVLAIWGLLRSFSNPVGSLLFGLGRVALATKWNIALLIIFPPVILLGSRWGALGIAWSMTALSAMLFVPAWAVLVRPTCGATLLEYSREVVAPTFCAMLAGFLAYSAVYPLGQELLRLTLGLTTVVFSYFLFSRLMNREFFNMGKLLLVSRKAVAEPRFPDDNTPII